MEDPKKKREGERYLPKLGREMERERERAFKVGEEMIDLKREYNNRESGILKFGWI